MRVLPPNQMWMEDAEERGKAHISVWAPVLAWLTACFAETTWKTACPLEKPWV